MIKALWEFSNSYRRYKKLQRFVQICFKVTKIFAPLLFERFNPFRYRGVKPTWAHRMLRLIEELGPTFIKFGQILSTRTETPKVLRKELEKLQEAVPPFSYEEVEDIIEQELAAPIEELFVSFNKEPIASASLAQVHEARLRGRREKVAVKVQRPNLEAIIELDLAVLETVASFVHKFIPRVRILNVPDIIDAFGTALRREIDFTLEGRHQDRVASMHKNDRYVKVPTIYWDYCTDKVLTMEFMEGIRINNLEELDKAGWDRYNIAHNMVRAYFKQILKEGFLHADPHPGNLYVVDEDVIVFLDFGMTEYVPDELLAKLADLLIAIIRDNDGIKIAKVIMRIHVGRPEDVNFEKLAIDLQAFVDRRFVEGKIPIGVRGVGFILNELLYVIFWQGVRLPLALTLVIKTLLYVEMLATQLYPGYDIVDAFEPHIGRRLRRKVYRRIDPVELRHPRDTGSIIGDAAHQVADYLKDMPRQLTAIMNKIERGELEFKVTNNNHNHLIWGIAIAAIIITLLLIIVLKI